MLYLNLLIMQLILVFILDLSGIMIDIKKTIWRFIYGKATIDMSYKLSLKPFSCSLCMNFWLGNIYLLLNQDFTILNIGYVCMLSYLTTLSKDVILTVVELLTRFLNYLTK